MLVRVRGEGSPRYRAASKLTRSVSIWLSKLSKEVSPSTQLDGFDISAAQFTPEQWLPSNVKLHTQNAFDTLPPQLVGKYDIVHIGTFCMVFKSMADFHKLLQNLIDMLSM